MTQFTEEQKALIREIAWEVGDAISARFDKRIDERIERHRLKCPFNRFLWILIGVLLLGGLLGGLAGSGAMNALRLILGM